MQRGKNKSRGSYLGSYLPPLVRLEARRRERSLEEIDRDIATIWRELQVGLRLTSL